MSGANLPEECSKQWEILLLLLSSEEKKIERTGEGELETMSYFLANEGVRKILHHWVVQMHATYAKKINETDTALKCDDVSLYWRQRGNDKFRANLMEDSYRCYSKSVLYAEPQGSMLPLAYANRSAALLKMKRFEECLLDVDRGIKCGYPSKQIHKLLLRQADCHIELGNSAQARAALSTAQEHADTLSLTPVQIAEFERHVTLLDKKLEALGERDEKPDEPELPECYHGENASFVAASNALELRRSETAGRYVATTEATKRGDVLFTEDPYAWVALPGLNVCEHCCKADINVVPCERCSRIVCCSEACREAARVYHAWECVGAQAHLFPTIGIAHLALRVLLLAAEQGFPPVPENHPEPTNATGLFKGYSSLDSISIYQRECHPFYRMFNLVTNFDKMNNGDYIQYALTATMLTIYLEHFTTFFDRLATALPHILSEGQRRLFAASLMLRALGQLVCNGHAALSLATVDDSTGYTVTEREVRRATAIYPSAAMMNHSCDPNIINTFHHKRLIIRCARELRAGAEVLNCYGPARARETTSRRRALLRAQYCFTCDCDACVDTDRKDFVLVFSAYACQSCKGPVGWCGRRAQCSQCHAEFRPERAQAVLDRADDLMLQASRTATAEERCERALAALRLRQQVWHRHHAGLRATADELARLYADAGEFSRSVELIKQNIQSLEYQFGSFSAEVAHELRKLSDVMVERIIRVPQHPDYRDWCLEAHKIVKKAVQLVELNYGSWEPLTGRLRAQQRSLATLLADCRSPDSADSVHHNLHYNLKI